MPYADSNGHRIHYTRDGEGPLVILQHGFLSSAQNWHDAGYVDVFKKHFCVACVDSLAHGGSDSSEDAQRYRQQARAQDIVAVIDAEGAATAHVLGYSMGGWIAVGVARYAPERLTSLGIGGWDCVQGMQTYGDALGVQMTFDTLLAGVRQSAPELTARVTPSNQKALTTCFEALGDLEGNADAVRNLQVPVLLWDGRDDLYHDPMQSFALDNGLRFLSVAGDHLGAMVSNGAQNAEALVVALQNP